MRADVLRLETAGSTPDHAERGELHPMGVCVGIQQAKSEDLVHALRTRLGGVLSLLDLDVSESNDEPGRAVTVAIGARLARTLAPEGDTSLVAKRLGLCTADDRAALELEILVCLLLSPVRLRFESLDDLESAIRVRANVVEGARRTLLDFRTDSAERPRRFWRYDEERGFVLLHGQPLIEALEAATQPECDAHRYSFSCWRATEYVLLLALARESKVHNPVLHARLTEQAERRALKGTDFDRSFVEPYGSESRPLPVRFFVPGDRTWFKNPDRESAGVTGYEGSYTFYLGGGRFADFWKPGSTHTLEHKCLEVFYWRVATRRDARGELWLDDPLAERLADEAAQDSDVSRLIVAEMAAVQSPAGRWGGGCVEATRDAPRSVSVAGCSVTLPDATSVQSLRRIG